MKDVRMEHLGPLFHFSTGKALWGVRCYSQDHDEISEIYLFGLPYLSNFLECNNCNLCRARVDQERD